MILSRAGDDLIRKPVNLVMNNSYSLSGLDNALRRQKFPLRDKKSLLRGYKSSLRDGKSSLRVSISPGFADLEQKTGITEQNIYQPDKSGQQANHVFFFKN